MSAPPAETIHRNARWADARPVLSVLSPIFRNDPARLIDALGRECALDPGLAVELVLVDDGSGDPALLAALEQAVEAFPAPASLVAFGANQGRSAARNRLMQEARGPYLLFLDSDMLPDQPDFLAAWERLIDKVAPTIAYGGFTTRQVPDDPALRLARVLAERVDCLGARDRMARGGIAVATSNLLVRADVMQDVPFDDGFSGWGWEDVDWALRAVAAGYAVAHVDIPATHLGLDEPEVLLRKFAQAGPNFTHLVARHPVMMTLPSTRLVRYLARLPGSGLLMKPAGWVARHEGLPMRLRSRAARLWRALHAAAALKTRTAS
jgi:glycosyltransferase involved in cell wall biosynthesis